jgi:hypothetical protein
MVTARKLLLLVNDRFLCYLTTPVYCRENIRLSWEDDQACSIARELDSDHGLLEGNFSKSFWRDEVQSQKSRQNNLPRFEPVSPKHKNLFDKEDL